jgi:hypothetical protein
MPPPPHPEKLPKSWVLGVVNVIAMLLFLNHCILPKCEKAFQFFHDYGFFRMMKIFYHFLKKLKSFFYFLRDDSDS